MGKFESHMPAGRRREWCEWMVVRGALPVIPILLIILFVFLFVVRVVVPVVFLDEWCVVDEGR